MKYFEKLALEAQMSNLETEKLKKLVNTPITKDMGWDALHYGAAGALIGNLANFKDKFRIKYPLVGAGVGVGINALDNFITQHYAQKELLKRLNGS